MSDTNIALTKQRTRESIKKNFLEMYKKNPLQKIKINDLIRICNISRGTFYFHFPNIYALYRECERDAIDLLETELPDVILSLVRRDYDKHIEVFTKFLKKYIEHVDMLKCFLSGSEKASFQQAWIDSIRITYEKSMEFSDITSPSKRNNLMGHPVL
jgi:AcrR family transcriptional regulator